jgi:hypothetical protein
MTLSDGRLRRFLAECQKSELAFPNFCATNPFYVTARGKREKKREILKTDNLNALTSRHDLTIQDC